MKILMVCTGNICRSPLAEALLRHEAEKRGLPWEIDSCGIEGFHVGEAPDFRTQKSALERGIDLSDLRARKFQTSDFDRFDLIFAMDRGHVRSLLDKARNEEDEAKIRLMLSVLGDDSLDVPDPYYGSYSGFVDVFEMLQKACRAFAEKHAP